MYRIVKDEKSNRIKNDDINIETAKLKKYYCIMCNEIMVYVPESEKHIAYFRHKKDVCDKIVDLSEKDKNIQRENKMSSFHINWQNIFPNENIEHRINENNKTHFADVYIESNDYFNIMLDKEKKLFEFSKKELIMEIQYSPISDDVLNKRQNFYKTQDRNLLWIFDFHD